MLSRSTPISSCHFCVESSAMGEMKLSPALLTTAFARPHVCLTKSRSRATSASLDTSAAKASDLAPLSSSAAFTSSSLACVRPTKTVVAPSSASASAVARPMPPAAQHRQKILETEQPMTVHQLFAHGVRAAAQDDALLDEGIDGVFLSRDRAFVAQHVLQRFGAEVARRKQHLERQPQEFVEQRFDMPAGLRARLGVGVGDVDRRRPADPVRVRHVAVQAL